jgi:hypothetical protein
VTERHTIWRIADQIQMDLRAAQAKMVELRSQLASLDLPDEKRLRCGTCGLPTRGPNSLAEHIYTSHDGPLPEHWIRADALALDQAGPDDEENRARETSEATHG